MEKKNTEPSDVISATHSHYGWSPGSGSEPVSTLGIRINGSRRKKRRKKNGTVT